MAVTKMSNSGILGGNTKYDDMLAGNPAYIPNSFESIATVIGDGSATTLSLTSIPSTYVSLQVRIVAKDGLGSYIALQINSDSGSNYARHYLMGNGSTANANGGANQTTINNVGRAGTNQSGVSILDIYDYASTVKNKTIKSFWGYDSNQSDSSLVWLDSGLWISTAAVTSLSFINQNFYAFDTTTKISLYGIKGS